MTQTAFLMQLDCTAKRLAQQEVGPLIRDGQAMVWLDINHPSADDAAFLRELGFHPLAVDDTLSPGLHPPKVEQFDNYLFVIVHGISYRTDSDLVETTELTLIVGPTYVISAHAEPLLSLSVVAEAAATGTGPSTDRPDSFAHTLLMTLTDTMMPMIDHMEEAADSLDAEVIESPEPATLEGLLRLRRSANRLYRLLTSQRAAFETIAALQRTPISEDGALYFRNLGGRTLRLENRVLNLVDRADVALAVYTSSVSYRQNETMKTLAIVASIFLPMSLVAGVYGMNFDYMPGLSVRWAYFAVLGVIGLIGTSIATVLWLRSHVKLSQRRSRWLQPFAVKVTHAMQASPAPVQPNLPGNGG